MSLAKRVEEKLRQIASDIGNGSVSVGFMAGATYPDTKPVAQVAFWNEFGHKGRLLGEAPPLEAVAEGIRREPERAAGAPPRPFFRQMVAQHRSEWTGQLKQALVSANGDGVKALTAMGQTIQGELIQSINDFTTPPLAASTIRRKGSAKPLIDTSIMVKSPTYKVNA